MSSSDPHPKCLRVMAEYGSSGIWAVEPRGPFRHAMVRHEALGLRHDLIARFQQWIERYWKVLDAPEQFDVQRFNEEGRALAIALKRHCGAATRILFAPQSEDGGLGSEEEIN